MKRKPIPKPGQRIELVRMGPDPDPVPRGTLGTVQSVERLGRLYNVHVKWDNGRVLGLLPDQDEWKVREE